MCINSSGSSVVEQRAEDPCVGSSILLLDNKEAYLKKVSELKALLPTCL
jgi:hypothetical protein